MKENLIEGGNQVTNQKVLAVTCASFAIFVVAEIIGALVGCIPVSFRCFVNYKCLLIFFVALALVFRPATHCRYSAMLLP